MINYYRDHIPRRAHLLAPLTAQTKNKKHLHWDDTCELNFKTLKAKLAQDAMLAYPNPKYPFIIEPDASDYQLGASILQNTKDTLSIDEIIAIFLAALDKLPKNFRPIAYFSRKLSAAQRNYTTLEKELLSIVETLLAYRSVLLGSTIIVFTDHRNLTFGKQQSQRALRWLLVIAEFNVRIIHRDGSKNLAADALSRLPLLEPEEPLSVEQAQDRFHESYLFYPVQHRMQELCPVTIANLHRAQQGDANLLRTIAQKPQNYRTMQFGDAELIQYRLSEDQNWRIVVPQELVTNIISWYHKFLAHPGTHRLISTINQHFAFPNMKSLIEKFVRTCDTCQKVKPYHPRDGLLPPKDPELDPWHQVQVDLVGPWQFDFGPRFKITVEAVSAIDPFTGLLELGKIRNKTSAHVATVFYNIWLCRYPTPTACLHDNGPEFVAPEFQDVLRYYGIKDAPTTSKNPQANSIIERVHLTMGNMLRALVLETRNNNQQPLPADIEDYVDTALSCTKQAINATVHSTTKESPGAFVFQRDMILPIQSFANWELARKSRSDMIHKNLLRENSRRHPFDWQPGMEVLLKDERKKMDAKYIGPFPITAVHTNGNVTIQRGRTFQRVNIRRIKLYHRR
jgi:hypothetical protein